MINSGVPQALILGPLLFLLYINDVNEIVEHCRLYLYADDCSLFIPVKHDEDVRISHTMIQQDLDNMAAWSKRWKLTFNAFIFRMGVGNRQYPVLTVNNDPIDRKRLHKHLGVILDDYPFKNT
jgi:hypothetical protein